MLNIENLKEFTDRYQTSQENVVREYCQHLFLSFLYQLPQSERLLFKGGTALRIIFRSPRFSEDLDFTGANISQYEVEELFTNTLANVEKTQVPVTLKEGKNTTGGYLGIFEFSVYDRITEIYFEVSLRSGKDLKGTRTVIESEYWPRYTLVHLPKEDIVRGKINALLNRHKPRDFYDYFFLLSGNNPLVKETGNLQAVLKLLNETKIDFRSELKKFLPASHAMHLRDFKTVLRDKIAEYLEQHTV